MALSVIGANATEVQPLYMLRFVDTNVRLQRISLCQRYQHFCVFTISTDTANCEVWIAITTLLDLGISLA